MSDPSPVEDFAITVTMNYSHWVVVMDHLKRGVAGEVYDALTLIYLQTDPAILAALHAAKAAASAIVEQDSASSAAIETSVRDGLREFCGASADGTKH